MARNFNYTVIYVDDDPALFGDATSEVRTTVQAENWFDAEAFANQQCPEGKHVWQVFYDMAQDVPLGAADDYAND